MTLQTGGLSMWNGGSWNSVSCQVPRSNVCRGLWQSAVFRTWIAKNRITVARIATDISMNLRADCHRLDLTAATWARNLAIRSPLESGLPRSIPIVAIRGIWPRNLANDRIPAPAILHRQFPCLLRHKFLMCDFLGVRQICGGLFRPKLYTNGLSWQTVSWYYPFNLELTFLR
jgi:hypothetical protein